MKKRVNIYVDGFNFYYGLKSKKWKKYYWIDIVKLFEQFIKPDQDFNTLLIKTEKLQNTHLLIFVFLDSQNPQKSITPLINK